MESPCDVMQTLLVTLNSSYVHSNLALRCLRAACRERGRAVEIAEYTINNRLPLIIRDICGKKPDVLAFSVYIWNVTEILSIVADIKKHLPELKIILGGPEVSYNAAAILRQNSAADYVLRGEIHDELCLLLDAIAAGTEIDAAAIPGLVWRSGAAAVQNDCRMYRDFETPFPYDENDIENGITGKIVYYESARGCPYRCSYCLSAAETGVRYRDSARTLAELAWLLERNPKQIKFVDRTFNANRRHYLPIMEYLAGADTSCNFHFEITAELVDDDFVRLIETAPAGRFQLEIGLQSFCAETLTAIARRNNPESIRRNIARLKSTGKVHLHVDLIAGLPFEDYATFGRSFDIAYNLGAEMLQLGFLKLLHGAPLTNEAIQHGYQYSSRAPYEIISNKYISSAELQMLKNIEEILELFGNSGRARETLALLAGHCGSAFTAYEVIARRWQRDAMYLQPHSQTVLYNFLYESAVGEFPGIAGEISDALKKEVYLHARAALAAGGLWFDTNEAAAQKEAFFKNAVMRAKYCAGFKFDSWRNLRNAFEIAVTGSGANRKAVLFDYRSRPPRQIDIDSADFWLL